MLDGDRWQEEEENICWEGSMGEKMKKEEKSEGGGRVIVLKLASGLID